MASRGPVEGRPPLYLDFNATTPPASRVVANLPSWLKAWGNPSSIHSLGREPKALLRQTRETLAQLLGVSPLELVYTSGGSESNSAALLGIWEANKGARKKIIVSSVEHASIRACCRWLAEHGVEVISIPISKTGEFPLDRFSDVLDESVLLVSVMLANNETGTVFPIRKIADLAHSVGALVHSDCVQGLGKMQINLSDLGVDLASFSGHKFYALRGSGLLFIRRGINITPRVFGGGQERSRRGGTENVLALASLGEMAQQSAMIVAQSQRLRDLRNRLESKILSELPDIEIVAQTSERLTNTSCVIVHGVDGESLLMNLDLRGICVSTGAACSAGNPEPSPVLLGMGYSRSEAQSSLRVSLGWPTEEQDIEVFFREFSAVVRRLRSISKPNREADAKP